MPGFHFKRIRQSFSSHDEQDDSSTQPQACNEVQHDDDLGKPTTGEYVGDAAKGTLKLFLSVAETIPVPGLSIVAKIAESLIEICEETNTNLERAEELKHRVKSIANILAHSLEGKSADEVEGKMKEDILALATDLEYIKRALDEINSQNFFLLLVCKGTNEDKVKECISRLDRAIEGFHIKCNIGTVNLLNKIYNTTANPLRTVIPTNIFTLRGRDAIVDDLVQALTRVSDDQKRPRVCILGPGGMGKTSTALAVMAHPKMKQFPESNRRWVTCIEATSFPLFLDILYKALGISQTNGDVYQTIIKELESSAPLILLFDNFETPWNIHTISRPGINDILRDIERIPHITLFITMRAPRPPGRIRWQSFDLEAVDEGAGRLILSDAYPQACEDPKVPELLQLVGYMPLAITMMAKYGQSWDLPIAELIEIYKGTGTGMLVSAQNEERYSMDICISLSIDSPVIQECPEARELLSALAMLPTGTTYKSLFTWWARTMPNLAGALEALRRVSLIEWRESHVSVLPVIRTYILDPARFPTKTRSSMIQSACDFLIHHQCSPGDPSYKEHTAALAVEESNLQAVLLTATAPETSLIEALLILTDYQAATRPRVDTIEHALNLTRQMGNNQLLLGKVHKRYAKSLFQLDRYADAREQYQLAREAFISVSSKKQAADCLLDIVEVYHLEHPNFEENITWVQLAEKEFNELEDPHGLALTLYYSGVVHAQSKTDMESINLLTKAKEELIGLKDVTNAARCSYFLSLACFWMMKYDVAEEWGQSAAEEYEATSQYSGDVTRLLGHVQYLNGKPTAALDTLLRCLESCRAYGRPLDIAQTLEEIGYMRARQDQKEDARSAYVEAMRYFETTQTSLANEGMARCRTLMKMLDDATFVPDKWEKKLLSDYYHDIL